jgi:hypothetical protein
MVHPTTYRTVSIDQVRPGFTSMSCRLMLGLPVERRSPTAHVVVAASGHASDLGNVTGGPAQKDD